MSGVQGGNGCSIIRASLTVALMVSLPRFGSLWAFGPTAHRADASLRACRGLGQSPKSLCRSTKTRAFRVAEGHKKRGSLLLDGERGAPGAQRARRRKPPGRGRRDRGGGVRAAGRAGTSWREHWDGARGFGASGVTGTAGSERREANGGKSRDIVARTLGRSARLWREWRIGGSGVRAAGQADSPHLKTIHIP